MWKTWWSSKSLPSSCGWKSIQFSSGSRSPREDVTSPPFSCCSKVWIVDVCVGAWMPQNVVLGQVHWLVYRSPCSQVIQVKDDAHQFISCLCVWACFYRQRASAESWSSASLAARGAACDSAWPRSPDRGTPPTTWSAPRCPPRSAGRTGGWREDAPPPTALTNSERMKQKKD